MLKRKIFNLLLIALVMMASLAIINVHARDNVILEYFNVGDNSTANIYGDSWYAQTFTVGGVGPITDCNMTYLRLLLSRGTYASDVIMLIIGLRNVDVEGKPTGPDLVNASKPLSALSGSPVWVKIDLEYSLSVNTKYAIVLRVPDGSSAYRAEWRLWTGDGYAPGSYLSSSNSGGSWSAASYDFMFEVWGYTFLPEKGPNEQPAIVATTTYAFPVGHSFQRYGFYAENRLWAFYATGTTTYFKSSTDGFEWSSETVLRYNVYKDWPAWYNPPEGYGEQFSVHYDVNDNIIHVAAVVLITDESHVLYRAGEPQSDGQISWLADWQYAKVGTWEEWYARPTVTTDSNGYPWISIDYVRYHAIPTYMSYVAVYKNSMKNGSWVTEHSHGWYYDPGWDPNNAVITLTPMADGKMYLMWVGVKEAAAYGTMQGKLWDGAWGSTETIGAGHKFLFSAVGVSDKVHVVRFTSGYEIKHRIRDGTWGVDSIVVDGFSITVTPTLSRLGDSAILLHRNGTMLVYREYDGSWSDAHEFYAPHGAARHRLTSIKELPLTFDFWAIYRTEAVESYHVESYLGSIMPPDTYFFDFYIENMNAENWLFAEEKYYTFVANRTSAYFNSSFVKTVEFNFTDGAGRQIVILANLETLTASVTTGADYASIDSRITVYTTYNYSLVKVPVMLRVAIIDRFATDFWLRGTTAVETTGWELVAADYCNIYSRGGLYEDHFISEAGRLPGGDIFELYAFNHSYASTVQYWRNLQHVKMQPVMVYDERVSPFEPDPPAWIEYAIEVNDGSGWHTPITMRIDWSDTYFQHPGLGTGHTRIWINVSISFFDGTGYAFKNETIFFYISRFEFVSGEWALFEVPIFVDLWFNRMNASSVIAARANSYYYPLRSEANAWETFWLGGTWGIDSEKIKESSGFATMYRADGSIIHAKDIELIRVNCTVNYYSGLPDTIQALIVKNYRIFDLTITTRGMEGIMTPHFDETKFPSFATGGFLGGLWSSLAGVMASIFAALLPMLTYIGSAAVSLVDGLLYSLTGESGLFSGFLTFVSATVGSVTEFMLLLADNITNIALLLSSIFGWIFTFFGVIWGILDFLVFNPAFNMFATMFTIIGVSNAWLSGTEYTNLWGQTYDFTNLSHLQFAGFQGGIVIFLLIFIFGFFIQILRCFSTMSLGPITQPISLLWSFTLAIIDIVRLFWQLIIWSTHALVQLVHAIRDILPRPGGI